MTRKPLILICYLLGVCAMGVRAQAPVANFSASTTSGCGPLFVTFKDLSSGSPIIWNWNFGNGQSSNQKNPSTTYNNPGIYTVILNVKSTSGQSTIQMTNYITVYPYPTVNFASNLTLACAPANISFTDQSVAGAGTISKWEWNLGDGSTSNQPNPLHVYTQPGYYNVSLKITNSQGCANTASVTRYLRVVAGIEPDFKWSQTSASCSAPFQLNFTNQTAGPGYLAYTWDFGNGNNSNQVNPSTSYPATSNYIVTLTAQSNLGCGGTTKKTISFPTVNAQISAPDNACTNTLTNFMNSSTPVPLSSAWDFGDGSSAKTLNAGKSYNTAGTYQVKVVNTYASCVDSVQKNIKILGNPNADFTAGSTVSCKTPFNTSFQGSGDPDITGWQWDFGDGSAGSGKNATHTYTTTGNFDVKLTVTNSTGCSSTITKNQFIQVSPPSATLLNGPGQVCIGDPFYPAISVNAVDGVGTYSWNAPFATPLNSNSPSPGFSYGAQGDYDISLTLTTNGGCTYTTTFNNAVQAGTKTVPSFTLNPSPVCPHSPVTFTNTSAPVDKWLWDFGDFDTSMTGPVTIHAYNDSGYFSPKLTVVNHGCSQTSLTQTVYVNPPIAKFGYAPDCINRKTINFTDSSKLDLTKTPISYELKYGDGSSTGVIPGPPPANFTPHTYATYDTFPATLTITDGVCVDVYPLPVILSPITLDFNVYFDPVCRNQRFTLASVGYDSSVVKLWTWQVGAQTYTTTGVNLTATIPDTGTYSLGLQIEDIHNCITTAPTHSIKVTGPIAKFIPAGPGGCRNSPIAFTDQSIPDGPYPLKTWTWDFGDGTAPQNPPGPAFTHKYADTNYYAVTMTVTDTRGCSDSYTVNNAVRISAPLAGFFATDSFYCPNAPLTFTDTSKGYSLSALWDFGDGSAPTANPVHSFPAASGQRYNIKLKVTDQFSCSDSLTRTNYMLIQRPIPAFSLEDSTTICPPLQTTFTPNPQFYDSLYWDFGDGATSTLPNTSHFYNTYDTFYAKLILRGPGGCLDTAIRRVFVLNPIATTSFTYSPLQHCDSLVTDFTIIPPGYTRFSLDFGDNQTDSSSSSPISHLYKGPNRYIPELFLQDSTGCILGIGGSNGILILGASVFFSVNPHAFCDSGTVVFNDFTTTNDPILSKTWDFGDGSPLFVQQPDPTLDLAFPHFYNTPGIHQPALKVTTQNNCAENYSDTLHVYQTPHPTITVVDPACVTTPIRIQGDLTTPNADPVNWLWNFGNGQTSGQQNPTIVYPASGALRISLKASVAFGCSDTISQLVNIHALPSVKGPSEISTPVGFPVTIPFTYSSGTIDYSWKPAAHLSCTDCPNPIADPTFPTLYIVTVTDSNNCKLSDSILVKTICNDKNYFVPNTFSPNGDGVNDVFYPRGSNLYNIQSMRVLNRWGQIVFERRNFPANSSSDGWDGSFNGRPAPGDAYVYIMEVVCDNAQVVALRGDVTLIR